MAGKPWSPLKAALMAFVITIVVGAGVMLAATIARGDLDDRSEQRGQQAGKALAPAALIIAGITYVVVRARRRSGQ
ncbi:MAG: hypothetical protein IT370_17235 [Deltaproteobacteria bacterium]|nr:hypothetical protein [Deltaproteobacteria bacterium]